MASITTRAGKGSPLTNAEVDANFDNLNTGKLELSGGTLTGALTLHADPTSALHAASKQYVDTLIASGIHYHQPVRVESPINLNATYDNGTAGVGATLTNAGTQAALVIDGVTVAVDDRVLVYEQTTATQNGIYVVTDTGSGATNWVLTRAGDADTYVINSADGLSEGSSVYVQAGTTGAGELYTCNTAGTITFGTTNIGFTQIASAQIYSAGSGLSLTGTQFALAADQLIPSQTGNDGKYLTTNGTATSWAVLTAPNNGTLTLTVAGTGLSGGTTFTADQASNATFTVTSDATSANTVGAIVARDGSGNFTAGTITAALSGNATTATTLQTARTINGVSFNGSANITITAAATNVNTQLASLGVGTAASGTAGEIRATNNITAYYSDDRLKTKLGNIENALAKLRTLSGFYYEANEVAQAFGYEVKREVGVSAQQVQAVQPEVVAPAPIDENYLTVRYERLVPLLIEAIKELDAELQSIKQQLKGD
jgi:hypothetical protein